MYGAPMYYGNPTMQTAQQRLQMMEAQYPQFANNPAMGYGQVNPYMNQPAQNSTVLKGRPVSNMEEANAAMIDFDGSLFVFPDKTHGKIYTKQLGLDGNIIFNVYSQDNSPAASAPVPSAPTQQDSTKPTPGANIDLTGYAKVEDVEKALSILQEKIVKLEQKANMPQNKGGNKQ